MCLDWNNIYAFSQQYALYHKARPIILYMLICQSLVDIVMVHIAMIYNHILCWLNLYCHILSQVLVSSVASLVSDALCAVTLFRHGVNLAQQINIRDWTPRSRSIRAPEPFRDFCIAQYLPWYCPHGD